MLCGKASVFIELKTLSDQAFYFLNNRIPRKLHNFVNSTTNQPQLSLLGINICIKAVHKELHGMHFHCRVGPLRVSGTVLL